MDSEPLDILLCSYVFSPSIGGIETVSDLIARGMTERGHRVTVLTHTPGPDTDADLHVVRRPSWSRLSRLIRRADIVWQSNLSARLLWPAAAWHPPVLITHHTWLGDQSRPSRLANAKRLIASLANNSFVSRSLKERARLHGPVIPNPYDERIFREDGSVHRQNDIVFVGRLVSDKGVDVLLTALAVLKSRGLCPRTTIVGEGPERHALETQSSDLGLRGQVAFPGAVSGSALARLLNEHRIMAVPSRWEEPFGLVALEGIACGCVVVGTRGGGLAEAIGPCGELVPNDDAHALASSLELLLANQGRSAELRRHAAAHLAQFHPQRVLDRYEQELLRLCTKRRKGAWPEA